MLSRQVCSYMVCMCIVLPLWPSVNRNLLLDGCYLVRGHCNPESGDVPHFAKLTKSKITELTLSLNAVKKELMARKKDLRTHMSQYVSIAIRHYQHMGVSLLLKQKLNNAFVFTGINCCIFSF